MIGSFDSGEQARKREEREREREKINQSEPTGGRKAYPLGYFSNCNPLCACWGVIAFWYYCINFIFILKYIF
jgi:hypothetical protein